MPGPRLSDDVKAVAPDVVAIRRDVHKHPEAGFKETRTADLIERRLGAIRVESKRIAGTGILATIKGSKPGPTMLVRADIDALPVTELNDVPYRSQVPGMTHACGHDGHVATALGAATVLAGPATSLAFTIKFMFHPPRPGGAHDRGGHPRQARSTPASRVHWVDFPSARSARGSVFASADEFDKITGKGGHGAAPTRRSTPLSRPTSPSRSRRS
jgi:amidohydrolase